MANPQTLFIQGIVVIFGLVGLYYLYQYLFGGATLSATTLIGTKQSASPPQPTIIPASGMPALYEGGEFTISMWVYVQNWAVRNGFNKHILSIGGKTQDTIQIYLGPQQPTLQVRVNSSGGGAGKGQTSTNNMATKAHAQVFERMQTGADLASTDDSNGCDLPAIDLQRWVNLVVCVNSKTVDVYIDGKLARSCVLPSFYRVDGGGYQATLLNYGGFGGYVSTVSMYGVALGPDTIYHSYMAGPQPITNFMDYLKSFFQPSPQGP
jgi:hypothetical protein